MFASTDRKLWKTVRKPCIVAHPHIEIIQWVLHNSRPNVSIVFDECARTVFDKLTSDLLSFLAKSRSATLRFEPRVTMIVKHIATASVFLRSYIDSWTLCGRKLPDSHWMEDIATFDQYQIDSSKSVMNYVSRGLFMSGIEDHRMITKLPLLAMSTSLLQETIVRYHSSFSSSSKHEVVGADSEASDNSSDDKKQKSSWENLQLTQVKPNVIVSPLSEASLLTDFQPETFEECEHSHAKLIFQCTTCHSMSVLEHAALCVSKITCTHCMETNTGRMGACMTCSQPVHCYGDSAEEKINV